ncbi:MAG: hypothetical protein A3J74_07315 [Elusimicrobia bacterium RIFCSPHIGHO2_02_FULL_57_9]|nr:MAG: hypothetical protein A3J74_07315 [Elusimicrobia bacterium RIFCSPHIGHO2_02_FULL_57_9]
MGPKDPRFEMVFPISYKTMETALLMYFLVLPLSCWAQEVQLPKETLSYEWEKGLWDSKEGRLEYLPKIGSSFSIDEVFAVAAKSSEGIIPEVAAGFRGFEEAFPGLLQRLKEFGVSIVFREYDGTIMYLYPMRAITIPLSQEARQRYERVRARYSLSYGALAVLAEGGHSVDHMLWWEFGKSDGYCSVQDPDFSAIAFRYQKKVLGHLGVGDFPTKADLKLHTQHRHILGTQGFESHELFMEGAIHYLASLKSRDLLMGPGSWPENRALANYVERSFRRASTLILSGGPQRSSCSR